MLRSRVDLYWSVPLPNLCRFSTTSLTGFSDYFHLFPAPLVRHMGNVWAAFARASCGGGGGGGGGERNNNGSTTSSSSSSSSSSSRAAASAMVVVARSSLRCGASRPEDVYFSGFRGVPVAACFPTAYFNVNPPRIHRGWQAIEQATWEAFAGGSSGGGGHGGDSSGGASVQQQAQQQPLNQPRYALLAGPHFHCRADAPCAAAAEEAARAAAAAGAAVMTTTEAERRAIVEGLVGAGGSPLSLNGTGIHPEIAEAIRQTGVRWREKAAGMGMGGGLEKRVKSRSGS